MRIRYWSSDVCSSDLPGLNPGNAARKCERLVVRRRHDDREEWPAFPGAFIEIAKCMLEQILIADTPDVGEARSLDIAAIADREAIAAEVRVHRSEALRVGKECGSTFRLRWWP